MNIQEGNNDIEILINFIESNRNNIKEESFIIIKEFIEYS